MNKEEIDELFEAYFNGDIEKICEMVNIADNDIDNILRAVMEKIEQGDYEYFSSKGYEKKYQSAYIAFLKYSTKVNDIKRVVEDRYELELNSSDVRDLIKATKDKEYIKQAIEDRDEFNFWSTEIAMLVEATNDKEYIKKAIEDRNKLDLYSYDVVRLIKAIGDVEYIKQKIEDTSIISDLNSYGMVDLIKATGDSRYIEQKIEEREKNGFSKDDVIELIKATKDKEYIKQKIEERDTLELSSLEIRDLIKLTGDPKYIKQKIKNRNELGLNIWEVIELIKTTGDKKYIEGIINGTEELGLNNNELKFLMIETGYYIDNGVLKQRQNIVNLPAEITIGIEIESEGDNSLLVMGKNNSLFPEGWKSKEDGSLSNGVEVVSPILTSESRATEQIQNVCGKLQEMRTKYFR